MELYTKILRKSDLVSNIRIVANGIYLPQEQVRNKELETRWNLESGYIEKRTGIKNRYYATNETIQSMALKAVKMILTKKQDIDLIITATTSTDLIMPGISNYIQKELELSPCICLDILAGCSGYINALDIAKVYMDSRNIKKALVIGVDKLSAITDKKDIATAIVLSDGAGATLIEKQENNTSNMYIANIQAEEDKEDILTYQYGKKLYMNGKEVYKYAVTKTIQNVNELLEKANISLEDVKYIVAHQSNLKIMKAIASRLQIDMKKMYTNIQERGNTFCASIPIALYDMQEEGLLRTGDKIILLGYGGGLNTGSILMEI